MISTKNGDIYAEDYLEVSIFDAITISHFSALMAMKRI